ncbi:MAG TPA: thiamine-phosphate kinase [Ktedonobacteraceae bacterium]
MICCLYCNLEVGHISAPGEFELINRLTHGLAKRDDIVQGVGDDCAVLDTDADTHLLATCDCQVEGVHFILRSSPPEQVGRKAIAINISDIAAMGGVPRYALISLIVPSCLPAETVDRVYEGLRAEALRYNITIVGGNIAEAGPSEQLVIDITLLGTVEQGRALLRSGARVGDLLCVTGTVGDSACGLYTLLHPDYPYPQEALDVVQRRHRIPEARVQVGRILSSYGPSIVTALLDISDGVSGDLDHLCECSHVGARVEQARLPLSPALRKVAEMTKQDPYHWALHGGEDYELLFTVVPAAAQDVIARVQAECSVPVTTIGAIGEAQQGLQLVSQSGQLEQLPLKSWDHLKPRS